MHYIYERYGIVQYVKGARPNADADKVIELNRMIPMPYAPGRVQKLCADFHSGQVWYEDAPTLDGEKQTLIARIITYDSSSDVNIFHIDIPNVGTVGMWIDKPSRSGLKLRFESEIAQGLTETTLWEQGMSITLPLPVAIPMLMTLEIYAAQCYDRTQQHLAAVSALTTREQIDAYDFTTGYPEKPTFKLDAQ